MIYFIPKILSVFGSHKIKNAFEKYHFCLIQIMLTVAISLVKLFLFKAYKNWLKENGEEKSLPGVPFNNEQLFFIGYAQVK